jgi:2-haloacid dehalogenase
MIRHWENRPAACVFDAYGTLLDVASAVDRHAKAIGAQAQALTQLWRTKQLQYTWLRSVAQQYVPFDRVTADALEYALEALGIADADLQTQLLVQYRKLDAFSDARRALAALNEADVPCWILSNGTHDMLTSATHAAGINHLLDGILSVDAVKTYKPDARVYQLAVEELDLERDRIAFVSSNGWDAYCAAEFGLPTIWCNRAAAPAERLPGKVVREIRSLDELSGVICADLPDSQVK